MDASHHFGITDSFRQAIESLGNEEGNLAARDLFSACEEAHLPCLISFFSGDATPTVTSGLSRNFADLLAAEIKRVAGVAL